MNKPFFLFFIFLILLNSSYAFYSGEKINVFSVDNCDSLNVNVKGNLTIEDGEYLFENCNETSDNIWHCDCDGYFNLVMDTSIKTFNTYSILINYTYYEESGSDVSSGGSTGGHRFTHKDDKNQEIEVNPEIIEEEPKEIVVIPKEDIIEESEEPIKEEKFIPLWIILGVVIMVISTLFLLWVWLIRTLKKKE